MSNLLTLGYIDSIIDRIQSKRYFNGSLKYGFKYYFDPVTNIHLHANSRYGAIISNIETPTWLLDIKFNENLLTEEINGNWVYWGVFKLQLYKNIYWNKELIEETKYVKNDGTKFYIEFAGNISDIVSTYTFLQLSS